MSSPGPLIRPRRRFEPVTPKTVRVGHRPAHGNGDRGARPVPGTGPEEPVSEGRSHPTAPKGVGCVGLLRGLRLNACLVGGCILDRSRHAHTENTGEHQGQTGADREETTLSLDAAVHVLVLQLCTGLRIAEGMRQIRGT